MRIQEAIQIQAAPTKMPGAPARLAVASRAAEGQRLLSTQPLLPTSSIYDAIDIALDVSDGAQDTMGTYSRLGESDKEDFLNALATLLQQGVVGTETVEVDGQPRTTFMTTRLGDPELRHAPRYRGAQDATPSLLDLHV